MKIICIGSINIDHVYRVPHFVQPGETLASEEYALFSGGKGANQSLAAARAGAKVVHAGRIGPEGAWIREKLSADGVDTSLIETVEAPTGHAVIQVTPEGENAIIIHGGANRSFTPEAIDAALEDAKEGDFLLLQNEINLLETIIPKAKAKGMTVVFNPAPMGLEVLDYPLQDVDIFILNETEATALTGAESSHAVVSKMLERFPQSRTVLTLGKRGVIYADKERLIPVDAVKVDPVDTTGAGDTFIGYFLAGLVEGMDMKEALELAVRASSVCITRNGAADSIPFRNEVG